MATYGVAAQPKLDVEGINIVSGGVAQSAVYFNDFGFEKSSSRRPASTPRWELLVST